MEIEQTNSGRGEAANYRPAPRVVATASLSISGILQIGQFPGRVDVYSGCIAQ
jgi:hypothetical protein